jgi:hypothetical protein
MKKLHFDVYRMLVRVRDFGTANKDQFAEASPAAQMFERVGESVQQLEQFVKQKTTATSLTAKEKAAARRALQVRLSAVNRTARGIAAVDPTFRNKFRLPKKVNTENLLNTGRVFLQEAQPLTDIFAAHALQVADLEAAVTRFEASIRNRDAGKELSAQAKAKIDEALAAAMKAVRLLDAIVRNQLKNDTGLLAIWAQDRIVPYPKPEVATTTTVTLPRPSELVAKAA